MATPNAGIPYVPENTADPAAGLNLSLNVIDALLQTSVIDMGLTEPPASPSDGDLHIVGTSATGEWEGQDDNLARYVEEGDFWQFYEAGESAHVILNRDDNSIYAWNGSAWIAAAGLPDAPSDGTGYVRKDAQWVPESGGGGGGSVDSVNGQTGTVVLVLDDLDDVDSTSPSDGDVLTWNNTSEEWEPHPSSGGVDALDIITEASAFTATPATHAGLSRYIRAGGDVTFDSGEGYGAGQVFNIRATDEIALVEDGVTLAPTYGGTLDLESGMAVTVIMTSPTTADVIGLTVAA